METEEAGRRSVKSRSETPAQRLRRLERQRGYNARRRRADSVADADTGEQPRESEEQRQHRLAKQREYNKRRREQGYRLVSHETTSQRERRIDRQRVVNARRRLTVEGADGACLTVSSDVEDEDARQQRLTRQREYNREQRADDQGVAQTNWRFTDMFGATEATHLAPVPLERVRQIEEQLQAALGADGLDECVCAVCDRLVIRVSTHQVQLTDESILTNMRRTLRPPDGLPALLIQQYQCDNIDSSLNGMMLSKKGVRTASSHTWLDVCDECHSSLQKKGSKPPKHAIANGFYVGALPDHLHTTTWIEKVMTQLVTVVAQTRVMRGGRHRSIRSHCMVFDANPGPPATLLPRRVDRNGPYRVVLAGPMTSEQTDTIRKLHHARGRVVNELLQFYKAHNNLYGDVMLCEDLIRGIDEDSSLCERIFMEVNDSEAGEAVDVEQESVARSSENVAISCEEECRVVESGVLLAEEEVVGNTSFVQRVVDLNKHEPDAVPRLRVEHSSRFAATVDAEAKMHPHLFPFGRGHPSEIRATHVSKRDCMRYYAMLSSRRFAQDPTFMLTAFARLSLENMYTLTSLKCRRYGSLFEGYESISRDDLKAALINNERRQRGEPRQELPNRDAERFLKSVELGSVSVWGSSAERRQCRQEAFGYQARFGQPSLFVTITPNTDNSYAMAHYSGILSVATLFDSLEARVPLPVEMKDASMKDDCASARLFMRTVDAFITHVLGVDQKSQQSRSDGGLFGRTKAYYGMVETQGRGTLHIHFLIWLHGAPVNSEAFEQSVRQDGSTFLDGLTQYADSIVTNELPLRVDQVICDRCNKSGGFLPLPIPGKARQNGSRKRENNRCEPLLVKCASCGQESSSQHVIRQVLMQHRPPFWPPPVRAMNTTEKVTQLAREVRARSSKAEALAKIEEREMFEAAVEQTQPDQVAEWVLHMTDSIQGGCVNADTDPMKQDTMHRLIEMLPPTGDRERMSQEHYAYMLASLVVNLNMHAWTHVGSCFKKSRATPSASICRYGFPRLRAERSHIGGSRVTMKRTLGHEYINGYNPTIMAMFKCNHDVQILFGGKDAINRIYYCFKYVTKPQRQIDSITAVALASFQRRQVKEAADAMSATPSSRLDVQRRRVTSMVYTFTNKQEIAGPLAALYLLRGSCSYSSAVCVRLPLSDVLKQLEAVGDYVCTLVQSRTHQDAVFTPASYLDDYIYRPHRASSASLYEFSICCYRRRSVDSTPEANRFQEGHPLSTSHCVAFRRTEAVPVIKGPRLIRRKDVMTPEELEEYAKVALVLFKPFREIRDLLGGHEGESHPWHAAYCDWEATRSEFTKMIMSNMNDYYAGQDGESSAVFHADGELENHDYSSESEYDSSDDAYLGDDLSQAEHDQGEGVDAANLMSFLEDTEEFTSEQSLQLFPSPSRFSSQVQATLQKFSEYRLIHEIASCVADVHSSEIDDAVGSLTVEGLKKWVNNPETDTKETQEVSTTTVTDSTRSERMTTVTEIIDHALLPTELRWNPASALREPPGEPSLHCGIAEISRLYTLNELQHGAFAIIATHLLRRWKPSSSATAAPVSNEELQQRQLRMFLGGEGGTGKSRVIQAVQALGRAWQRPGSVVVSAMTGKAATIVNGRTLASFNMSLKGRNSHIALQDIDCLIVDEVSMMSKRELLRLDMLLQTAKRVKDVAFGGIHIVLVGDFLQLPPVGADPIFIDPETKKKVLPYDQEGFDLWRTFDKVVVLRESVRFKDDPEWGNGCSNARYGNWTPEFVQMINQRVIGTVQEDPASLALQPGTVFVTPDNDTRTAINGHFVACTTQHLPSGDLPIRVVANFKGALNNLSFADVSYIMGLPDTSFGRMAPYLDLIRGMPIQITQNIRTKKGVANGTMGYLHSVKFPAHTNFRRVLDRRTQTQVLLPDKHPLYALVGLVRGQMITPIGDGVQPDLFPVFPDVEAFNKAIIQLTPSSTGEARSLAIKIQQFPFVCAIGATVYKVQGESLRSMAVVDWKVPVRGANKPQQAYLMVSRVVKREALVCLKPLTTEVIKWAKPPLPAIEEDKRLANESDRTLDEFYTAFVGVIM